MGRKKLSYEFIKDQFEKEGWVLLSKKYVNYADKLKVKCNNGHIINISYGNFKYGCRCKYCSGKKKHTFEFVKEQIEKENYELLSKEYKNAHSKLKVKCNEGHEYYITWNAFQRRKRCAKCNGNKKLTYEFVKERIKKEGYKLISKEYINARTKLKVKCNKGHEYEVEYDKFKQGCRCPICDYEKTSSKAEIEIAEYVKSFGINIIENDRTNITNPLTNKNLELDIWMPEINKAIEFNGLFWHSSKYSKYKDKQKTNQCKEKEIDLLVIEEQDWIDDKDKCLNRIKNFIYI